MSTTIDTVDNLKGQPTNRRLLGGSEDTWIDFGTTADPWARFPLQQHDTLWFDDGNLLVRGLVHPPNFLPDNLPTIAVCCCHRSILKRKAPSLQNVLTEAPTQGTVYGDVTVSRVKVGEQEMLCFDVEDFKTLWCTLVRAYGLSDDGEELEAFWPAMEYRDAYLWPYGRPTYPAWWGPRTVLKILTYHLPTNYLAYLTWFDDGTRQSDLHEDLLHNLKASRYEHIADRLGLSSEDPKLDPARFLALAEELNLVPLLPFAWYNIARLSTKTSSDTAAHHGELTLDALSDDQIRRLLIGRERLRDLLCRLLETVDLEVTQLVEDGSDHAQIRTAARAAWKSLSTGLALQALLCDPFGAVVILGRRIWTEVASPVVFENANDESGEDEDSGEEEDHDDNDDNDDYMNYINMINNHGNMDSRHKVLKKVREAMQEVWDTLPEIFEFKTVQDNVTECGSDFGGQEFDNEQDLEDEIFGQAD